MRSNMRILSTKALVMRYNMCIMFTVAPLPTEHLNNMRLQLQFVPHCKTGDYYVFYTLHPAQFPTFVGLNSPVSATLRHIAPPQATLTGDFYHALLLNSIIRHNITFTCLELSINSFYNGKICYTGIGEVFKSNGVV